MISGLSCDTNILIYSIDTRDPAKHHIGKRIVDECSDAGAAISLQCLNEFAVATTRKQTLSIVDARMAIDRFRRSFTVFAVSEGDLLRCLDLIQQYKIQFYDSLLIATVERAGCTVLLSEDMNHGQRYGGVTVLNPFLLSAGELDLLLA